MRAGPFQHDVWVGTVVLNRGEIRPGDTLFIWSKHVGNTTLKYPVQEREGCGLMGDGE